jgi:hypothetical protein
MAAFESWFWSLVMVAYGSSETTSSPAPTAPSAGLKESVSFVLRIHEAAAALFPMFYNLVRVHRTLKATPATDPRSRGRNVVDAQNDRSHIRILANPT